MIHVLGENNSLFNQFISEIRDEVVQKDSLRFRRNLERVGEIFAYEISKHLDYKTQDVTTPLGVAKVPMVVQQPVLATILRAGLPLHQGLLNYFDKGENCFISAYRKYDESGEFHIEFEYISSPSVDDKIVILSDPMLATGASMEIGYRALLEKGTPKHVHMVSVIASQEGVDYLIKKMPHNNYTLWIGAIDKEMTPKSYIVPGLGDAGDLAYGIKIDSKKTHNR
ncbi:uracil phosphoribosyltransferase [Prolixibacter bellariivorans]|uniref:Uracil phosphoribosyltransferase n=1 Tax=Prolixibacter bellariivorans TaxID=314319 RepID=A0A5M4AYF5_9BACT|nr:uracil phosphoribosyltransferase [Prolixibacter bellariivorans]GET32487.1 uracil phosphoribosyltransferase [Prolixibacter bellariivorans]